MPSTSLGPYTRLFVGALPVAGLIVKGTTVTPGALQGGRLRRVTWTNKGAAAHFAQLFIDPANCGAAGAPTNVPANSMTPGNPVVLPTSTTTVPSYSAAVSTTTLGLATFVFDFGPDGMACPGGIVIAGSTTANVFTALAATDPTVTVEFR